MRTPLAGVRIFSGEEVLPVLLISLIIPCFNEEEALPLLYPALCQTMEKLPDFDFELLFVNDGSRDGTMDVLRRLARQDPRVQ